MKIMVVYIKAPTNLYVKMYSNINVCDFISIDENGNTKS